MIDTCTTHQIQWTEFEKKNTCFYIFSYIFVKLVSENSCITVCVAIDFSKKNPKRLSSIKFMLYLHVYLDRFIFLNQYIIQCTCSFWSIPLIKRRDVGSSDGSETFEHQVIIMNRQSPPPPPFFHGPSRRHRRYIYIVCVFIVFFKIQFHAVVI